MCRWPETVSCYIITLAIGGASRGRLQREEREDGEGEEGGRGEGGGGGRRVDSPVTDAASSGVIP